MNLRLKRILYLAVFIVIGLAIVALLYKGKYLLAGILIFATWGILFVAGAYGLPLYVKRLILKYLIKNNGHAGVTEIVKYCASKNRYFIEFGVKKWLGELEVKKKIKIENEIVTLIR